MPKKGGIIRKKIDEIKEKKAKKEERYVRADRVDSFKEAGWKVVKGLSKEGERDGDFGIKTHQSDLVLMEK